MKNSKKADNSNRKKVTVYQYKERINWSWCVRVLFLTFALSIMFSVISELVLTNASLIIAVFVILILMFIGIVADCIGVATTACSLEVIKSYVTKNMKGAQQAMILVSNAEKVSVICCDIIGDVCGILSGAAGASIVIKIIGEYNEPSLAILVSALVSGVIAGMTIFGKSIEKGLAVKKSEKIVLAAGKVISVLIR